MSEYDYVIVGAGSAGCVIAARLAEDPDVRVALIEAGPPDDAEDIHRPSGFVRLRRYDWRYRTAPEPNCLDRRIPLPRGRVLGGSSSTNAMIYIRGGREQFDAWDVPGWSAADLLPYFKKSEDNERGASELHGAGGPMRISDQHAPSDGALAFVAAAQEAGLPANDDLSTAQRGVGLFQRTQRDGRRVSSADAFLADADACENLTVLTGALVTGIDLAGGRATGVSIVLDGARERVEAAREVILCAGAYNSPQLLMLSGIGPQTALRAHGIEVALDLPAVGSNLSDHPATEISFLGPEPPFSAQRRRWRGAKLLLAQEVPYRSSLAEAGAFLRLGAGDGPPDVQLHGAAVEFTGEGEEPTGQAQGFWISPCLLSPHSRGSVELASADPRQAPVIRKGFYEDPRDLELMTAGLRFALEVFSQPALAHLSKHPARAPGGTGEAALRTHAAATTFVFYHPVGTCRMGTDPGAVVDADLRVNGIEGLRVIDASVLPHVPSGNINAAVVAVAERAADLVRYGRALEEPQGAASQGIAA